MQKIKPRCKRLRLKEINNLKNLRFDQRGLMPVVIQDEKNAQVLMVAYMNKMSLQKTLSSGLTHFWSRSRKCLWLKGETSGHFQIVKRIYFDCDNDTLLIIVKQQGVACHTGQKTCFYRRLA